MALKSFIKKIFSFGSKQVEEVAVEGVPTPDDSAIREAEARAAEEKAQAEAAEAARKAAEEKAAAEAAARAEAERWAAEEEAAAKAEAARKAAEEAERAKAEEEAAAREKEKAAAKARTKADAAAEQARLAREREQERVREATRQREEERNRVREAEQKAAAERKAAEERAKAEAKRAAEEEKAKAAEAKKREAEDRKRAEAEEKARAKAEADAKAAAEAEERERAEADERRKAEDAAAAFAAAEAAKKAEAEREAAEKAALAEAEAKAEEEAARAEAARRAAEEEDARAEAERVAAEENARAEAARKAAEEAEQQARLKAEQDSAAARTVGKVTVAKTVAEAKAPEPEAAPAPKKNWLQRLRDGLSRSSRELTQSVTGLFTKRKLDEETLQDLEDILIRADLGLETAIRITDALSQGRYGKNIGDDEVRAVMAAEIEKVLVPVAQPLELDLSHKPHVILVVGVNGTGKTTTIGKLAAKLRDGGLDVMLAAGDTFRAAAIEQLHIWGERVGAPVISSKLGSDAAGLAFDAFKQAKEAGSDVLIVDTAGRLQNRTELMDELAKIVRVLGKLDPEAPHTVLQTLDATTGQNALSQVEIFRNVAGVNGLVMTKLDGTARGGIMVAIAAKHKLPVYFVGVGEQVDDLEPFEAKDFAKAIVGEPLQEPV